MLHRRLLSPLILPVYSFAATILAGAALLYMGVSHAPSVGEEGLSFVDALFTATSAVCVTGLTVVDTGSTFSQTGQWIILLLIQLGGLGIMTYSSLLLFLLRRRVSLTDRLAVGQALMHDASFHLGRFLYRLVRTIVCIELAAACLLYIFAPTGMGAFGALFHAVSAFCNAGFGLRPDNLMPWQEHTGVSLVIMFLIVVGGIGFSVIDELLGAARTKLSGKPYRPLSRHTRLVLSTTAFLIVVGAALIWLAEYFSDYTGLTPTGLVLPAFFQSVTCRTAGFNTMDISRLTDFTLMVMICLMFVGGSPGSCAGGIKTTSFRVLAGFVEAQLRGRRQNVLLGRAVDAATQSKALTLFLFAIIVVTVGTMVLSLTEGGMAPHTHTRFQQLDLMFEVVSAFGTVGLTTGVTPHLSVPGKLLITLLMFIGRIGPVWLLATLQHLQSEPKFRWPEVDYPIG